MPIPIQKEIEIPLLHLINSLGGEVKPKHTYEPLADYFKLTKAEREQMLPNTPYRKFENNVQWARMRLVYKGFIDNSVRGVWKITEKGKKELAKYGLLDKPFSAHSIIYQKPTEKREPETDDLIAQAINELLPDGVKKFPDDFLDKDCTVFHDVELPGTQLRLAPLSQTIVTSPKGYFRYQAKNPPEAKYILYAHKVGVKKVKIPSDNLSLFKTVKNYEKYCDELTRKSFELFLEFTNNEDRAEELTREVAKRNGLKGTIFSSLK